MQIFFLLYGCYMRVLNEKYIQAQQKNNNNRTNSMTHIYILSVIAPSHRAYRRKKNAEARITRERKWSFFFCIFFWTIQADSVFFSIRLFLSLCLLRCMLLLELSAFLFFIIIHPSIYISICRQSREKK